MNFKLDKTVPNVTQPECAGMTDMLFSSFWSYFDYFIHLISATLSNHTIMGWHCNNCQNHSKFTPEPKFTKILL
jgi:hypothetical protein